MAEIITKDPVLYFKGRDWVHQLGFCAPDRKQFMIEYPSQAFPYPFQVSCPS